MEIREKKASNVRDVIIVAVFTALATGGGFIKLPSPVGSIALDSAPGFFVAGFFSPILGGITGLLGHIASSAMAGFPLGFIHILIAGLQCCWCFLFGAILRKGNRTWALILASIVAILANGIAAPLILALLFNTFREMLTALIPFLLFAAMINVIISALVVRLLARLDIPGL